MWKPRRLTTLWAFTAYYRDSFAFIYGYLGLRKYSNRPAVDVQNTFRVSQLNVNFLCGKGNFIDDPFIEPTQNNICRRPQEVCLFQYNTSIFLYYDHTTSGVILSNYR
jgi:hypothetical protein